eukprot:TRINITY_DN30458_c0_g1_i2.p1 TRINITY_DN30458_c0_g1~~TRINITY_DN30458_c0_g1_i2.p1  ORF type:complete len:319 (+),score=92.41 TRINITY_DN30458_c0_g1_i2:171-1127(+)
MGNAGGRRCFPSSSSTSTSGLSPAAQATIDAQRQRIRNLELDLEAMRKEKEEAQARRAQREADFMSCASDEDAAVHRTEDAEKANEDARLALAEDEAEVVEEVVELDAGSDDELVDVSNVEMENAEPAAVKGAVAEGTEDRDAQEEASRLQAVPVASLKEQAVRLAPTIEGVWKLVSRSEEFDQVLVNMGLNWAIRKIAKAQIGRTLVYTMNGSRHPPKLDVVEKGMWSDTQLPGFVMDGLSKTINPSDAGDKALMTATFNAGGDGFTFSADYPGKPLRNYEAVNHFSTDGKSCSVDVTMFNVPRQNCFSERWERPGN